jgi:hypothetical protein
LTGIGVIEGYPDDSFRPGATISRGAAAAIVARLFLGPDTANNLVNSATPFSDVPADHWASGYIAFCVSRGITEGYPDGTYRPGAQLRASQFAIMILRALGYGANGEYSGDNWAVNAIVDGVRYGILNGIEADFTDFAPRNDVAQYAFNALFAGFVDFSWDIQNYQPRPTPADRSLYETVFRNLDRSSDFGDGDDLGRPTLTWLYGAETVFEGIPEPVAVFNKDFTQADLFRVVGNPDDTDGNIIGCVNTDVDGKDDTAGNLYFDRLERTKSAGLPDLNNATVLGDNVNGVRTYIYRVRYNEDPTDFMFVVIAPIFVDKAKFTGIDEDNLFADVDEDDPALFYRGEEGHYFEAVSGEISGVLTVVSNDRDALTLDGAKKDIARGADDDSFQPGSDPVSFYVDEFGFVLYQIEGPAVVKGVAFVAEVVQRILPPGAGGFMEVAYFATIIDTDGEEKKEIPTKEIPALGLGVGVTQLNNVYTYEIKDGLYEFTVFNGTATTDTWGIAEELGGWTTDTLHNLTGGTDINTATANTKVILAKLAGTPPTRYDGFETRTISTLTDITLAGGRAVAVSLGDPANAIANIVYIFDEYTQTKIDDFVFVIGLNIQQIAGGRALDIIAKGAKLEGVASTIVVNNPTAVNPLALYSSIEVSAGAIGTNELASVSSLTTRHIAGETIKTEGNVFMDPSNPTSPDTDGEIVSTAVFHVITVTRNGSGVATGASVTSPTSLERELVGKDVAYVVRNADDQVTAIYIIIGGEGIGP